MITTPNDSPVMIEKESISALKFPKEDVLKSKQEIEDRNMKLKSATSLGNLEKHKVKIVFRDVEGLKMVHTTIWGTTENNIILKSNINIPLHCIVDIIHVS
jgi:uncharacterized protein (UPF0248 family)